MGGIRKIGRHWHGRWTHADGIRRERKLSAETRTLARLQVAALEKRALDERLGLSDGQTDETVQGLYDRHFRKIAKVKLNWRTVEGRFRIHILPAFGKTMLRRITPADIERFLVQKQTQGLAPQTCEHLRVHLAVLFNFAIKKAKVLKGENPAAAAERPRLMERAHRYLRAEHIQAVLDCAEERWQNFMALCVYTGMRAGELRALRRHDIHPDWVGMMVARSGKSDTTKSARARFIPLPAAALPYLMAALKASEGCPWVFVGEDGEQIPSHANPSEGLRRALKKAGLAELYEGLRFHDLRKTYLTHFYEATGDALATQRIAGHSQLAVTDRIYLAANEKHLVRLANGMDFKKLSPNLPRTTAETTKHDSQSEVADGSATDSTGGDGT